MSSRVLGGLEAAECGDHDLA